MPEFLNLLPPAKALNKFLDHLPITIRKENLPTSLALGRVTAEAVLALQSLPEFNRSTMDGYAVSAADTHGVSESLPVYLTLIGEVPMGGSPDFRVEKGQCALIHTGGMLPPGADSVVMVEHTQTARSHEIEVLRSVASGENVIEVGEDVKRGQEVISQGVKLRPAEIGGLMALGITEVVVSQRPHVGILSSGDEVIPPDQQPSPGQVRDINTYTLGALVEQAGAIPHKYGIIPDKREDMLRTVRKAKEECDMVIVTAGSSASTRDLTAEVMDAQGEPGVLVHGVNVKPGKPTILAVVEDRPLIGLPGNPVSALVIAGLFVTPILRVMTGLPRNAIRPTVSAQLTLNVASKTGRENWVPVRMHLSETGNYLAEPIFGKSNLIFTLVKADGLIRIPEAVNGLNANEDVLVYLF